jgi:cytochrome b561
MSGTNTYSAPQIALHWAIAVLIALQFLFEEPIGKAFDAAMKGGAVPFDPAVAAHVAAGVLVLGLALWRIALRLRRGAPGAPQGTPPLLRLGGAAGHLGLYVLMVLVPVSGLVAWFGGVGAAAEGHEVMTTLLLLLVGVHVAAAFYHQFVRRDGLLRRMARPGR